MSETDLQDFYQNCRDFGIDLSRLNQQQLNRLVSASEKITLKDFAWNRVEKLQSIEIKDDILALNRTCQNIEIKPFRNAVENYRPKYKLDFSFCLYPLIFKKFLRKSEISTVFVKCVGKFRTIWLDNKERTKI